MSQPEHEEEAEFDPRSLSKRDWDIITGVLRERAAHLAFRAQLPGVSDARRREMEEAVQRRYQLAGYVLRMKKLFTSRLDSSQAPEL
jgi:hypothetical protein